MGVQECFFPSEVWPFPKDEVTKYQKAVQDLFGLALEFHSWAKTAEVNSDSRKYYEAFEETRLEIDLKAKKIK